MLTHNPRLTVVAQVMLLLGPLLAGLGGHGWEMIPAFTVILVMWGIVLRPDGWPQRAADWADRSLWPRHAGRVVLQALTVALLFAIGRAFGVALGSAPPIWPVLPLAMSLTAIALARLVWDGARAVPAIAQPLPDARHLAEGQALADRMLEEIAAAPDMTEAQARAHLRAMSVHVDASRLRAALDARVATGRATPALLTAHRVATAGAA